MFVYQNKENTKIYISLNSRYPKDFPDYILEMDNNNLKVNDLIIDPIETLDIDNNFDIASAITITSPSYINLDNKVITAENDIAGDGVFHVMENGVLTIDGNGIIDSSSNNNDYNMAIWADNGKVIINNGTFTNTNVPAKEGQDHYDLIYVKNNGVVEINGGYFDCKTPRWTLNSNNSNPGTIIVKGGTFKNYDPSNSYTDENGSNPTNFVAPGYKVKKDGDLYTVYKI